jgi:hypothetical protein
VPNLSVASHSALRGLLNCARARFPLGGHTRNTQDLHLLFANAVKVNTLERELPSMRSASSAARHGPVLGTNPRLHCNSTLYRIFFSA